MITQSRVTILVKAYPQPSKSHAETVCCAGIDDHGNWKRLYPIRFRQLLDDQSFVRWSVLNFSFTQPTSDSRIESCRVLEESIKISGKVTSAKEKQSIIDKAALPSEKSASEAGKSLTLIRPKNVNFTWKSRTKVEILNAREAFARQASQATMFDKELAALEPCPYVFQMSYDDEAGPHTKTCADWETQAAFFKLSHKYSEQKTVEHLRATYCEKYVSAGIVFALGNIAKRPQTCQLLGIFSSEPSAQMSLSL